MLSTKSSVKTNTMVAQKKSANAPTTPASTSAVQVAPKKSKVPAAKTEVAVPVLATTTTDAVVAVESTDALTRLSSLQDSLKSLQGDVTSQVRTLQASLVETIKLVKKMEKSGKRRVKKDPATMTPEEKAVWEARRANNAFLKPKPISDELCSFMGIPSKSLRSQTDVTKFLAAYVKTHSCFDPNFKRRIVPDTKLTKLLRVKDGQEVTYLNLQSFVKVHYLKPAL